MLFEGHSYSRTFFSRTVPAALLEDENTTRAAKPDNSEVSTAPATVENGPLEPSRNSLPAAGNTTSGGNFPRGGQSKRSGRGRSNWNQRNGYRRPVGENPAAAGRQTSDTVGKTRPNVGNSAPSSGNPGNSAPSSSENPGSSAKPEPPLPQRNNQRRSQSKDKPPTVNSVGSAETW